MAQNNQLHSWTRLDAQGRRIAGSNVLRKKRPVTGKWVEDDAYTCCNPSITLTATPTDETANPVYVILACDGTTVATYQLPNTATTVEELVVMLNNVLSFLGTFTTDGSVVTLNLDLEIAQSFCGDVSLVTMTITD